MCVFRSPSGVWQQSRCGADFDFYFHHQIFLAEHRRNSSPQGVAPEIRFKRHVQTNLQPINLHEETDLPRNKEVHVTLPGLRLAALNNQELTFWLWLDKSSGWWMGPGVFHNSRSGDLGTKPATAGEAVHGPVCSRSQIRWPFSWRLQVSRCQACPSLFCFATFHSDNYCSVPAVFLQASPLCSILGFFVLLHDDITYLSWNFGVAILTHLHESKVWPQGPVLPGLPRGPLLDSGDACHSCGQGSAYSGWVHWFEPDKLPVLLIQMEQTVACPQCGFNIGMS